MPVHEVSYDNVIALADVRRHAEAIAMARQLADARPEVVDYVTLLARLQLEARHGQEALDTLHAAMDRLPTLDLPPMHRWSSRGVLAHRYGTTLMSMGRDGDAIPWLHEAAQRNGLASGDWTAHLHAGLASFRAGDFPAAGRYWYDLLYRAPDLGAADILPLVRDYIARAEAAGQHVEPLMRVCLGRIALDNPELLELGADAGDALAFDQAERVLHVITDHAEARRLRAPLRFGAGDVKGALHDLGLYIRLQPDPQAQVRELSWRHQAAAALGEPTPWDGFGITPDSDDGGAYLRAAEALADFIESVPASAAALEPQVVAACRAGIARFDQYFATGRADPRGHGGNADPHLYALLCRFLARRLPDGKEHLEERVALLRKSMAASEFIGQWLDLLDCYAGADEHGMVVELAGEVLNRYPLEHDPATVTWAFSRMMAALGAMGGDEQAETARAALEHMDARQVALPVEARSEAAQPMAHARVHYAELLQSRLSGMDEDDRAQALAQLESHQRRALLVEDAWVFHRFGQIRRDLGEDDTALGLFEQAIALAEGDPADEAPVRVQRGRLLSARGRHDEAMTDFESAFAARPDWDAETWLHATQAAAAAQRREQALAWFEKARALHGAEGRTRSLYTKVETTLRTTRPMWKLWGV